MNIGEKVLFKPKYGNKEIVKIINIENEWTSFPHGSGTNYTIYTLEKSDGIQFKFNTLEDYNDKLISKKGLLYDNKKLELDIENILIQIKENNYLIETLS